MSFSFGSRSLLLLTKDIVRTAGSKSHLSNLLVIRTSPTNFRTLDQFKQCAFSQPTARTSILSIIDQMTVRHYNNSGKDSLAHGKPSPVVDPNGPVLKTDGFVEDLQPNAAKKLALLLRDYGPAAMVIHICISLTSLGICYALVEFGIPINVLLDRLGITDWMGPDSSLAKITTGSTNFVIAYAIHKCFMPLRIIATGALTPGLVNFLRSKNILKPHHVSNHKAIPKTLVNEKLK